MNRKLAGSTPATSMNFMFQWSCRRLVTGKPKLRVQSSSCIFNSGGISHTVNAGDHGKVIGNVK